MSSRQWVDAQGHRFRVWLRVERGPGRTSDAVGMMATGPGAMRAIQAKVGRGVIQLDDGTRVGIERIRRGVDDLAFAEGRILA